MKIRGALVAAFVVAGWAGPAEPAELSPAQHERLRRGEVVLLDALPAGGSGRPAQGGTGLVVVRAPLEIVWPLLVDYPRHAGLYPYVVRSDVLEATARYTLVRYVVGVGPLSFGFHVSATPYPAQRRIEWRLARERPNGLSGRAGGTGRSIPTATASYSRMPWPRPRSCEVHDTYRRA